MATRRSSEEMSLVPTARSVPFVAGDTPAMREWAEQLVERARSEGVELTGDGGLLTAMVRQGRCCVDVDRVAGTGLRSVSVQMVRASSVNVVATRW